MRRLPLLVWFLLWPVLVMAQVLPPPGGGGSSASGGIVLPETLCVNEVGTGLLSTGVLQCGPILPAMAPGLVPSGGDVSSTGQVTATHLGAPLPVPQGGLGLSVGVSGGIPYFSSPTTMGSSDALPLNAPLFGGGPGQAPVAGTISGTTRQLASVLGPHTTNKQLMFDANGNVVVSTADIGGTGPAGILPVPSGGTGLASGTGGGLLYFVTPTTMASSPLLPLDAPLFGGGAGQPVVGGTRSGTTREVATVTGPHTPQKQLAFDANGNIVASTADLTGVTPLTPPAGGTGLTAGIAGGLLYFVTPTTMASTPVLTLDAPVFGGGAGQPPVLGTRTGTTHQVATATGTLTPARQVAFDAQGNLIATASPIGAVESVISVFGRQGSVVAQSGDYTAAQVTDAASTTAANVFTHATGQTMRRVVLSGGISGTLAFQAPATAGTSVVIFPVGTLDLTITGGPGQVLQQGATGGPLFVGQVNASNLLGILTPSQLPPLQSLGGILPTTTGGLGWVDTTFTGSGHKLLTTTSTLATGQCLTTSAPGDVVTTGLPCGSGTVSPGTATHLAVYSAGTTLQDSGLVASQVCTTTGVCSGYQAALGFIPENVANKSAVVTLGTSNVLYPTQGAVKGYVDTTVAGLQVALTWGDGLAITGTTVATDSREPHFLASAASPQTCGTDTQGKILVLTTGELAYCDGATVALLQRGRLTPPPLTWNVTPSTCTSDANGGKLTLNGSNEIVCASDQGGTAGPGAVSSVFGRSGAVVAQTGDYTVAQVTNAASLIAANVFTHVNGQSMRQLVLPGSTSGSLTVRAPAVAGTSTLVFPGASTDFSTTGGAGQVVRQNTVGGALTVGNLSAVELSNGIVGTGAVVLASARGIPSTTPSFLFPGTTSLACGAGQAGVAQVLPTGELEYCDNAAVPLLRSLLPLRALGLAGTLQASNGAQGLAAFSGSVCSDPERPFMTGLDATGAALCGSVPTSPVVTAHVLTDRAEPALPNAVNLGAQSSGVLSTMVSGGVATVQTRPAPTGALVGTDDVQELDRKRVNARTLPIADTTPLTLDLSTTDVAYISELSQDTRFNNPQGIAKPGQWLRLQVHSTIPRVLSWGTVGTTSFWTAYPGFPLPTTTSGGTVYDTFLFQYNPGTGTMDLIYNSQLAALTVPTGVVPGTYPCPVDLVIDPRGRIASVSNGTCGGGAGGAAGSDGDIQFKLSGVLAADTGQFKYSSPNHTLVLQNLRGSVGGSYQTFRDGLGHTGYLLASPLTQTRGWLMPDEDGELCVKNGSCNRVTTDTAQRAAFYNAPTTLIGAPALTFQSDGSSIASAKLRSTAKNANATLVASDGPVVPCTSGATDVTFTLPAASSTTQGEWSIIKVDTGLGRCLVVPAGSDTFNYGTTAPLVMASVQGARVDVRLASTTNWTVLATVDQFDLSTDVTGVLPVANGGTGSSSILTGLVRGSPTAMTAAELSGVITTSGSNVTSMVDSRYIPARNLDVEGSCALGASAVLVTTGPKLPTITCTDTNTDGIDFDAIMPDGWNGGTVVVKLAGMYAGTPTAGQLFRMNFSGQCVRPGDPVAAWAITSGATATSSSNVAATLTMVATANLEYQGTSSALTLSGTCAGGAHIYLHGLIDATNTNITTIANVKLVGVKVEFTRNASD